MRYLSVLLLFLFAPALQAQTNQLWKGYFSYNEIRDISQSTTRCFAAAENAIFSKNTVSGDIKTINTIDGLPSEQVSAIYHSVDFNKTLVGYRSGLMVVINETDNSILRVVDILNKQLAPDIKKINHFMEHDGIVYVSCDFGIVQFNLTTLEFGDTYFIGQTTPEIVVKQTAFFNGFIYAATPSEGLRRAAIDNPNLIDATQWLEAVSGNFTAVEAFGTNIVTVQSSGQVSRSANGTSFTPLSTYSPAPVDLRAAEDHLIVVNASNVYLYNTNFALETQITAAQTGIANITFTCATILGSTVFLGTFENGVVSHQLNNPVNFDIISPSGPLLNNVFSVTSTTTGNLWAVFGAYDTFLTPLLKQYGISKFNAEKGWLNIPFSAVDGARDLVRVTVNPSNEEQVFVSSYMDGLLKFDNDVLTMHYTPSNSGLESLILQPTPNPNYVSVRIEQSAFDKSGNLWLTNGLVKNSIKVLKGTQWQSYSVESILDDYYAARLGRMVIDKNSTKWICTLEDGLIGFNEAQTNMFRKITEGSDTGNLPSPSVQAVAIDNRNALWIGTRKGLRVLSSVDRFLGEETQLRANSIIILEDGLAQELMYNQFITDIVVDGANNKWISTLDAGVFLVSSDGQQTIHHFTSSNSPLPSNNINDMDINPVTGEVFFATVSGLVSFKGTAIKASDDLKNVYVFPNPVRPEYTGTVKISGLTDKADVKITDIEGNLVYEAITEGGTLEWDTTAFGRYRVASGVYMIFISTEDASETKVKKVMIVR